MKNPQVVVVKGGRVRFALNAECVAAGGRKEYPDGKTGTMTGGTGDSGTLAFVTLDVPFIKREKIRGKMQETILSAMYVPKALLVDEKYVTPPIELNRPAITDDVPPDAEVAEKQKVRRGRRNRRGREGEGAAAGAM